MTNTLTICPYSAFTEDVAVHHAETQRLLKGEDVVFVHKELGYRLFAVADGHGGEACANYVKSQLWMHLKPQLPQIDTSGSDDETYGLLMQIRKAVMTAFLEVDNAWYRLKQQSGTTLTVALLIGRVLTIANVGDSAACLHDGHRFLGISMDHRLDNNPTECDRFMKADLQLAPLGASLHGPATPGQNGYGPMRVWPGGLAVSRSIGDADLSPHVFPFPHIRQLLIPTDGARLMLASDGVWDVVGRSKIQKIVCKKSRMKCVHKVAELVEKVQGGDLKDDATVMIVDVLRPSTEKTDFKYVVKERKKERSSTLKRLKASLEGQKQPVITAYLSDEDAAMYIPEDFIQKRLSFDGFESTDVEDYTVFGSGELQGVLFQLLPST